MKFVKSALLEKKFPTVLGLVVLVGALVVGIVFNASGPGIFSPRATPQTTPKQVKVTNVTESTFTVSFLTDEKTTGFIKYGTQPSQIITQVSDDRDQLAGKVETYTTHHITVRGLQPETTYLFKLGTGTQSEYDDNGNPYSVKTGAKISGNSIAQTIYGTVLEPNSNPAEGSIVYVSVDGVAELSTLVRSSGTWAIPLSQARISDLSKIPTINTSTPMNIKVQGQQTSSTATLTTTVGQPQLPVETITLGQNVAITPIPGSDTEVTPAYTASESATISPSPSPTDTPLVTVTASVSATVTSSPSATPTATEVVTNPSTESGEIVSGRLENTVAIIIAGLSLLLIGSVLFATIKQ